MCTAGIVLFSLFNILLHTHGFLTGEKIGMQWRIIATVAMHKKVQIIHFHCDAFMVTSHAVGSLLESGDYR